MLKLTCAVLAVTLAGTANAAGWRSMRIDASSETSFEKSMAQFAEKLSIERRYVFGWALKDIWAEGTKAAEAEQREYTASEYFRQIDGLGYEEIVMFTDPTGDTAEKRYQEGKEVAYAARRRNAGSGPRPSTATASPWPVPPRSPIGRGYTDSSRAEAFEASRR